MQCKNHSDREAVVPCQKHQIGYCGECLENGVSCTDPSIYCKFRTQCVIWEMGREGRKKTVIEQDVGTAQAAA